MEDAILFVFAVMIVWQAWRLESVERRVSALERAVPPPAAKEKR